MFQKKPSTYSNGALIAGKPSFVVDYAINAPSFDASSERVETMGEKFILGYLLNN